MVGTLLLLVATLYAVQFLILHFGTQRPTRRPLHNSTPKVSVIVAARNEERNIDRCITSILNSSYPPHLTEIILINDGSSDRTGDIICRYAQEHRNIIYVPVETESTTTRGKANALAQGIKRATGEILLFTDADCEVGREWIRKHVSYFEPDTGLVGGFTQLRFWNWFTGMQALDWFFLYTVAAALVGLRRPVTAVGNNLCVRRVAYEETGGFDRLPFSVTEDYILVNAIRKSGKWKIRFPMDPDTLVISNPCPDMKSLFRQKHRWAAGAGDVELPGFIVFAPVFVLSVLIILFPVTGVTPVLTAFGLKTAVDSLFLSRALYTFKQTRLYRYILFFEILFILYVLLVPIQILFSRKVIWKERSYER